MSSFHVPGEGDACDDDIDGDGLYNMLDNCPLVSNPHQEHNGDPMESYSILMYF